MGAANLIMALGGDLLSKMVTKPMEIVDKQLEFYNNRKDKQLEHDLKKDEAKFIQDLQLENRKMNAEIDDMIAEKENKRHAQLIEAIMQYQKEMAECTVAISNSIGMMSIELRDRAQALVIAREKEYKELQERASETAIEQGKKIAESFPEGSKMRDMMEEGVCKQYTNIIDSSRAFMETIRNDFSNMLKNIDAITKGTIDRTNELISTTFTRSIANNLSGNEDDTRLIENH